MLAPSATILLEFWERARHRPPHERSLQLLAWAMPDERSDALADFDLGLRDWHLLRLRRALFGPTLVGHGGCPHCGERLEVELDARALQEDAPPPAPPHYVDAAGRRYRLPNSRDLAAVAGMRDPEAAADVLFAACCLDTDAGKLDEVDVAEVEHGLSALAAERGMQLELRCAACGDSWLLDLDPGAFCWEEIDARAQALLDDVHRLASAYGWSEHDILALGDARRAAYLDRIG